MTRFFFRLGSAMVFALLLGQLVNYFITERSLLEDVRRSLAGPGQLTYPRVGGWSGRRSCPVREVVSGEWAALGSALRPRDR